MLADLSPDYYLVQGDTARRLGAQLLDASKAPVDLSLAEMVTIRIKRKAIGAIVAVHQCVIEDAPSGLVHHIFPNSSTNTAGDYLIQFQAFWGDNSDRVETYPKGDRSTLLMRIQAKI